MRRWILGVAVVVAVLSSGTASAVAGPGSDGAGPDPLPTSWQTPEATPVGTLLANPVKIEVGGAVAFVLDVERFERY